MIRHIKIVRDSPVKTISQSTTTRKTMIVNEPIEVRDMLD